MMTPPKAPDYYENDVSLFDSEFLEYGIREEYDAYLDEIAELASTNNESYD